MRVSVYARVCDSICLRVGVSVLGIRVWMLMCVVVSVGMVFACSYVYACMCVYVGMVVGVCVRGV